MNINKYFWSYNDKAIKEAEKILKNPDDSRFVNRAFAVLSRTMDPKEVFSIIGKETFISSWPKIRKYWFKVSRADDFRAWWETIYENLCKKTSIIGEEAIRAELKNIGHIIRNARIEKGWTQSDFAYRTGLKQPDISAIESGRRNTTLVTLAKMAHTLGVKSISL